MKFTNRLSNLTKTCAIALFASTVSLLGTSPTSVQAASLMTELVINGGAETGDTTGWISGGIDAVIPDVNASGFGNFAFTGGTGPAAGQTLFQSIDVSGLSAEIDLGTIESTFSIYLQSRTNVGLGDTAQATLTLVDDSDSVIDSIMFEDMDPSNNDWDLFSDIRLLPAGTRAIEILLTTSRPTGLSSDGFFDEVSLVLKSTSVPEPSMTLPLALGISGIFGFGLKRRKRA